MKPGRDKEAISQQAKLVVDDHSEESEASEAAPNSASFGSAAAASDGSAADASSASLTTSPAGTSHKPVDSSIGRIIAEHYELLECIGEGGMSTVYRAKHLELNKEVAVKLLAQPRTKDANIMKRFKQEAVAISKLDHSNIVRLRDYGVDSEGEPYLVMDLVAGQSLAQLLEAKHKFSLQDSLSIISQTLSALAHAHSQEIVHRDIKPSNIMICFDKSGKPVVQVVDFGIAKLNIVNDTSVLTRTGDMFGSPHFMSPEQCLGDPVDCRSDLYSLGCLFYELLEGHPPYQADNLLRVLHMHISEKPPKLSGSPSDKLPASVLDGFIAKAMAREPQDRYASAEAMQSDINIMLQGNIGDLSFMQKTTQGKKKQKADAPAPVRLATYAAVGLLSVVTCSLLMFNFLNSGQKPTQEQMESMGHIAGVPFGLEGKPIRVDNISYSDKAKNWNSVTPLQHDGRVLPSLVRNLYQPERKGSGLFASIDSDEFLWSAMPSITPSYSERLRFLDKAVKDIEGKPLASVPPDQIIYYARHLQQSGDINRALNLYDQVLEHPSLDATKRAEVNNWRGDCLMDSGLLAQAADSYRLAAPVLSASKEHKVDSAILKLKLAYCLAGPHNGLVLQLHSALRNATFDYPQGGTGSMKEATKLRAEAIAELRELYKEANTASAGPIPAQVATKIQAALGSALLAAGEYKEAATVLEKANNNFTQVAGKTANVLVLDQFILRAKLAMALAKSGQVDQAISQTDSLIAGISTQTDNQTSAAVLDVAPSLRAELLPRLHYSLAYFYELKLKAAEKSPKSSDSANSATTSALKQRIMSNLSTALAMAEPTYHDTQFKGIIWQKIAQFNREFDPSNTTAIRQAQHESLRIFTDRQSLKSIRPTVACEDEQGL